MAFMFYTGSEMTQPRTCGKTCKEVSMDELRKLSPYLTKEEEQSPCAKYIYQPMMELAEEHQMALKQPLPDTYCYMPEDAGWRMLDTPYEKFENGYGVLPNGIGFSSVLIRQPGRTDEKVKYFREKFAVEGNLYYKAWYPGSHLIHFNDGAVENFGWGFTKIEFSPLNFNLDIIRVNEQEIAQKDPHCLRILGAGSVSNGVFDPGEEEYAGMLMYDREVTGGRELRVRYWDGLTFCSDGTIRIKVIHDREEMFRRARLRAEHCMREYSNEQYLMEKFWAERNQKSIL